MARFQFILPDRQTTDKTDCLTPLRACTRGVIKEALMLTSGDEASERLGPSREFYRHGLHLLCTWRSSSCNKAGCLAKGILCLAITKHRSNFLPIRDCFS